MKEELKQVRDENIKRNAENKVTLADLEALQVKAEADARKGRREEKNDTAKLRRELTLKEAEKTSVVGEVRREPRPTHHNTQHTSQHDSCSFL
jgi:hypothetical protein